MPELEEVGGNGQPFLKGLPVLRGAGLTTSTTLFLGTRQDISSESGRDRGLSSEREASAYNFLGRSYSLLFHPQFQSFKLLLGHALQSHRCGQIQSWNVFHFVAVRYLVT